MRAGSTVSMLLLVSGVVTGALGLFVFFTERGVANEIKGFVLLLIAGVLIVGGCLLWELREIRNRLENKDS
jgi:hypothetical protein